MSIEKIIQQGIVSYPALSDDIRSIKNYAESHDFKFYLINADIRSKNELFRAMSENCEFPDYFGFNWDALKDCLEDYSFATASGYIFGLMNSKEVEKNIREEYKVFIEIFAEASGVWKKDNIPFCLLLG